jgi:branched-chain amino acid transport system substrate-binding protein
MKRLVALGAIAAFALAAGLLAGCGSSSSGGSGGGSSPSASVIKVGVVSDFSFPLDVDYIKELKVLVDNTNANGGLDVGGTKYQVDIVSYDSKGSPETGRSAVQRLITQDKVNFILGDATADGWLSVTEAAKMLVIVASPSPNVVTPRYKFVFQSGPFTTQPAMAWGWISDNVPEVKTVAGAFPDNIAGHAEEGHLRALCGAFGQKVLGTVFYPVGTTDFSAIATKLVGLGADSYTTASGGPVSDSLYYKSLVDAGFKGKFVSYTTITPDQIAKVIPIADVEGMTSAIAGVDLPTPTPAGQELKDLWIKAYGKWTYPAVTSIQNWYLLVAALQAAQSLDSQKVADTIAAGIEFPAALGQGKTVPRPDMGNSRCVDSMYYTYMSQITGGKAKVAGEVDFTQGQAYIDKATAKPPQ